MITATIQCDRPNCKNSKNVDIINDTDLGTKINWLGFKYAEKDGAVILLCEECMKEFQSLESKVTVEKERIYSEFFKNTKDQ